MSLKDLILEPYLTPRLNELVGIATPWASSSKGHRYLLNFENHFTRNADAETLSDITSETLARILVNKGVVRHETTEVMLIDRETKFMSYTLRKMYEI